MKFSEEDAKVLLANGEAIQNILPENTTDAWETFAQEHDVSVGCYQVTLKKYY